MQMMIDSPMFFTIIIFIVILICIIIFLTFRDTPCSETFHTGIFNDTKDKLM